MRMFSIDNLEMTKNHLGKMSGLTNLKRLIPPYAIGNASNRDLVNILIFSLRLTRKKMINNANILTY